MDGTRPFRCPGRVWRPQQPRETSTRTDRGRSKSWGATNERKSRTTSDRLVAMLMRMCLSVFLSCVIASPSGKNGYIHYSRPLLGRAVKSRINSPDMMMGCCACALHSHPRLWTCDYHPQARPVVAYAYEEPIGLGGAPLDAYSAPPVIRGDGGWDTASRGFVGLYI